MNKLPKELGAPVGSRRLSVVVDGCSVAGDVPEYEWKGSRVIAGDDWHIFEVKAALRLVEASHVGPEGLKFMRKVAGVPRKDLSQALGVSEKTVQRWETPGESDARRADVLIYYAMVKAHANNEEPLGTLARFMEPPGADCQLEVDPGPIRRCG